MSDIGAGEDNGTASEAEPTEEKDAEEDVVGDDVGADHVKEPHVNDAALAADAEAKEERILNIEKTEDEKQRRKRLVVRKYR